MLSVEIKVNGEVIKRIGAVRREAFQSEGSTHQYEVFMIVDTPTPGRKPDVYPVGFLDHRYCAGAVSLAEKMLIMTRRRGMHK